jgi:hypothetical protein
MFKLLWIIHKFLISEPCLIETNLPCFFLKKRGGLGNQGMEPIHVLRMNSGGRTSLRVMASTGHA